MANEKEKKEATPQKSTQKKKVDKQKFVSKKLAILSRKNGVKYEAIANRVVENNK